MQVAFPVVIAVLVFFNACIAQRGGGQGNNRQNYGSSSWADWGLSGAQDLTDENIGSWADWGMNGPEDMTDEDWGELGMTREEGMEWAKSHPDSTKSGQGNNDRGGSPVSSQPGLRDLTDDKVGSLPDWSMDMTDDDWRELGMTPEEGKAFLAANATSTKENSTTKP